MGDTNRWSRIARPSTGGRTGRPLARPWSPPRVELAEALHALAGQTCGNWTKSGAEGAAMVGHHDRMGLSDDPPARWWNSSHLSRGGCSQDALKGTGGAGLLYCLAAN
jgi:hypothetical protein